MSTIASVLVTLRSLLLEEDGIDELDLLNGFVPTLVFGTALPVESDAF